MCYKCIMELYYTGDSASSSLFLIPSDQPFSGSTLPQSLQMLLWLQCSTTKWPFPKHQLNQELAMMASIWTFNYPLTKPSQKRTNSGPVHSRQENSEGGKHSILVHAQIVMPLWSSGSYHICLPFLTRQKFVR